MTPEDCYESIKNANHEEALKATWEIFFSRRPEDGKKHVLWLHGVANAGKSYYIRRLREIFASQEISWKNEYLPATSTTRPELTTQLVTCEEFDYNTAFSPAVAEATKILFEGRGGLTRVGPFKQFDKRFEDARFVLASNRLPPDVEGEGHFVGDIWEPIMARTVRVHLLQRMPVINGSHYSVNQLAHALLWFTDRLSGNNA